MSILKGGLIGCGYFARNHLNAWKEVQGAQIVAVCDLDGNRATAYAHEFGIKSRYTDVEAMFHAEPLDFVDIVTQHTTHRHLVEASAVHNLHVICQKPMAPTLEDAKAMVNACESAGVQFMVHENFRWQTPMRALKGAAGNLGELFFGRISFRTAFNVYANQPYLAEEKHLIIADLGVHLLDLARFFMGEVDDLYCQTASVKPGIKGEDVATVMLKIANGATCLVEVSYASKLEEELCPQTLVHLEGAHGSATLGPHYALTVVKDSQVTHQTATPRSFPWMTSPWEVIQDSVIAIEQHWVDCLRENRPPETLGRDSLRTLELVFGAYQSVETGTIYKVSDRV